MAARLLRTLFAICLLATLSLTVLVETDLASARSRENPMVTLVAHQCPPGMTEHTLEPTECREVTSGFDVRIVAIEGTQPNVSLSDAELANGVFSWSVAPTNSDLDNWGIGQTELPPNTTSYLVSGATAHVQQAPLYDYRFTTSVDSPYAALDLYIFSQSNESVVIPSPEEEDQSEPEVAPEPESTEVVEEVPTPEPTTEAESDETNEPGADLETRTSSANRIDPDIELPSAKVDSGPAPVRIAANRDAVILENLKGGDSVDLLGDPVERDGVVWHEVRLENDSTGWVEVDQLEGEYVVPELVVADSTELDPGPVQDDQSEPSAETAAAAPPGDSWYEAGSRVMVVDPPMLLRSSPDLGGEVLDVFYEGELLVIDGDAGTSGGHQWFGASRLPSGPAGYVAAGFAVTIDFLPGDPLVVGDLAANVRSAPGDWHTITAVAYPGAAGTVVEGPQYAGGYAWYLVEFHDGQSGWVSSSLLALGRAAEQVEATPWFAVESTAVVVDPPVNLRSEPGLDGASIGSLGMGEVVTIWAEPVWLDGFGWYLVDSSAGMGYVAGAFLAEGFAPGSVLTVVDGPVYLRSSAGIEAGIVDNLADGAQVLALASTPVSADGHVWIEVATDDGLTGYVASEFLGS